MAQPVLMVMVRFRSKLSFDEVMKVAEERAPEFRALEGLQQKYYFQDPESGEIGGLYLWESSEALAAYQESELKTSIAAAYQAEAAPRVEVFRVLMPLRQ